MKIELSFELGDTGYVLRKCPKKIIEVTIDNIMLRKKGNGYPEGLYWVDELNLYYKFDVDIFTSLKDAKQALGLRKEAKN